MQSKDAAYYQAIIGGKVIGMDPNEDLESFESKRPNNAFTGFLEAIMRDASGGVFPYEFSTDPTKAGGAVVRLIVAKAQRTFEAHQRVLIERFLNPLWGYFIAKQINLRRIRAG
jgi:capsid protein